MGLESGQKNEKLLLHKTFLKKKKEVDFNSFEWEILWEISLVLKSDLIVG